KFLVIHETQELINFDYVKQQLGMPIFIKPANTGSSVGVSKVFNQADFQTAVATAFAYDHKVIIEAFVPGREIECAVLGNEHPCASLPGEIILHHEFYSYEAKYLDETGATLVIPADIGAEKTKEVQELAIRVFQTLCCQGMGRVDFFLTETGELYVNEINTIP